MEIVRVTLQALFGTVLDGFRAWQADQNLKALGYAQAQRDAAVSQIKTRDAVIEAQNRMAAVPAGNRDDTVDRLRSGQF